MRSKWAYLLAAALLLGGTAWAENPPPPPSEPATSVTSFGRMLAYVLGLRSGQNIIELAWDNIVVPIGTTVAGPLTMVAVGLFMVGLLYRIYNLVTLEVSAGALIYSVIRFFFIALFLTMSNYYTYQLFKARPPGGGDPAYVLSGGRECTHHDMALSHIALCGWVRAYKEGYTRFIDNTRAEERMAEAIAKFAGAILVSNSLLKAFDVLKIAKSVAGALQAEKAVTGAKEVATIGSRVKEATDAAQKVRLSSTTQALINAYKALLPLAYFFLVVPVLIFLAILYISGAFIVLAAAFLPIAIALVAFGITAPLIRTASMIFAQHVLAFLLPFFIFTGAIFAIERPAAALEGAVLATVDVINGTISNFQQKNKEAEEQLPGPENPQDPAQQGGLLEAFAAQILAPLLKAALVVGVLILMVIIFLFLGLPIFLMMVAFSYSIALYLIWNLPNAVLSLIGGGGIASGPGERMTPGVRGYRT